MKRLLILLLICLLPTQVFAGSMMHAQEQAVQAGQDTMVDDALAFMSAMVEQVDAAVDGHEQEHDDYLAHIGAGDEPVIYAGSFAALDFPAFFPSCRSDLALKPPFLPPAGRPPRG